MRDRGRIFGSVNTTSSDVASGIFNLNDASFLKYQSVWPRKTLSVNAHIAGGGPYGGSYHKRAFSTMSNEVTFGNLSQTQSSWACGSTNYEKMIASCYTGTNTTSSDLKDLSSSANSVDWGTTSITHTYGMADGNDTYLVYYGGWNGSSNSRQQTRKTYSSNSNSAWGQGTVTGTRHSFGVADYDDNFHAGAGDNNSNRTNATWRTSISSASVTSGPGLPSVMYVMQAAGDDVYAAVSGNYGNSPYTHLNQINRYIYSSNSMNTNWMSITGVDGGISVSNRDDTVYHGGKTQGWQKFSLTSGGNAYFGSTTYTSGSTCRGPGV